MLYTVKDKPIVTADWQVYVLIAVALIGIVSIIICFCKARKL